MAETDRSTKNLPGESSYHHGMITKLFPSNNTGIVRTESGRELPFSYEFVILLGRAQSTLDLREGETIGYDLGWTPKGIMVTKIKTYPKDSF
jgi:hypothetical protein